MMQSPRSHRRLSGCTSKIEGFFSLVAEPQLVENSRLGSEGENPTPTPNFTAPKSQTTQWDGWHLSGGTASVPSVYLYDGKTPLEEVDVSGNVLARYTQSSHDTVGRVLDQPLAQLRSGTTSYYLQDGLGSISSLSSSTGTLSNTYTYDSFGRSAASTGTLTNPFQYTAREFDPETGIYDYRARYYDPTVGRFLSEDPIKFKGGLDFYGYVRNDPVSRIDPTGRIHQAWGESPFDGRLHDDPGAGLEVLCTKGRNIAQDMNWLEHSIFVRSVEIDALGNNADAGHIDRRDAEVETLMRCHDECDKDKKPEPSQDQDFWRNLFININKFLGPMIIE